MNTHMSLARLRYRGHAALHIVMAHCRDEPQVRTISRRLRRLLPVLLILTGLACPPFAQAGEAQVRSSIDHFHNTLLATMRDAGDFASRYEKLRPAVLNAFDFTAVSRMSLGKTWRKLAPEQQAQFIALMQDLVVSTYADRFDSFNEQSFQILEISEPRPRRWLVRVRLNRKEKKPVNLDYYLRDNGIFNVVADGVSDLALRRADYAAVLEADGYDGLLANIGAKIDSLKNAP